MKRISSQLIVFILLLFNTGIYAERVKDITSVHGVRSNPLVGYGLVVGLDGTGDSTTYGQKSLRQMLSQFGISVNLTELTDTNNIAVVALSATLPAFSKPGQTIDVTVSSMGKSKSLRGGNLLMTPLRGADGKVYAIAQGNLVVGGLGISAADGSQVSINVPVDGRIPNGATIERMAPTPFLDGDTITFNLQRPDFTTSTRLAKTINQFLGSQFAVALDGASVQVNAPTSPDKRVAFLSVLENLELTAGIEKAKIVVNSRTGTVVIGQKVRIKPAAVTHGNLSVSVTATQDVSQPDALSNGTTTETKQFALNVKQDKRKSFAFNEGATLEDLVGAINQVGASPGDLVSVLEALKEAGALDAELVVI